MTDNFWLIQVEKVSKNDIKNTKQNNIYACMYIYTYTKEKMYILCINIQQTTKFSS